MCETRTASTGGRSFGSRPGSTRRFRNCPTVLVKTGSVSTTLSSICTSAVACPTQTTASLASFVTGVLVLATSRGLEKKAAVPRTPARATQHPGRAAAIRAITARSTHLERRRRKGPPDVHARKPDANDDRRTGGGRLVGDQADGL